jgi:hypothetical protein
MQIVGESTDAIPLAAHLVGLLLLLAVAVAVLAQPESSRIKEGARTRVTA